MLYIVFVNEMIRLKVTENDRHTYIYIYIYRRI